TSSEKRKSAETINIHTSEGGNRHVGVRVKAWRKKNPGCNLRCNFFSKRSFKSNPLKRTKSVTKLERKKPPGGTEQE
ncbi:unnamed protein product, partial [Allacma fusca]